MLVSLNAVIKRINRKLAPDGQVLKVNRSERAIQSVGKFYILDAGYNIIVEFDVDPEQIGREMSCLAPHEKVAQSDE